MSGPSLDSIVALLEERKRAQSPVISRMQKLRDAYNGDIIIPLPEMDKSEASAVANLIATGLDQSAMRIASTYPNCFYPALEPGNNASEKRANTRRRATLGWWEANKLPLKLRRRARLMIGYASSPVVLRPDPKRGIAKWEVRNPLSTFVAPTEDPDEMCPPDAIFTFKRGYRWLQENYPEQMGKLNKRANADPNTMFELLEYMDGDILVTAVIGEQVTPGLSSGASYVELERVPNRTGMNLAVVPGRITLDRAMGQFDGLVGMYQLQAKLMALEVIAVERGIFPDTYLVSRPGESAKFISGPYDGRTGMVNIIQGGEIREAGMGQGTAANATIDRLERNMRITSGTPAEFGGESTSNIRTGKRGDAILSAVVDFPVQEAQEILAASLVEENKRAIAIAKSYFGNQRRSFYVSQGKVKGHVDYIPNKDFETDANTVTYAYAGADANALVVGLGQRVGIGTMSKRTAQEIDPLISDPEVEHDRTVSESLEAALLSSVQTQAAQGAIPPADLAKIMKLVVSDKMDLASAVEKVQREAQERQATPAPMGAPETMPGLAMPGMGAEQPAEQAQGPAPSLDQLLGALGGQ